MSSFRIAVDLTDFFNDHRRRAYIFIRPELRTVSCLENHISETFGLDSIAIVVNEELYLPSAEKIEVVQKKDVLKVVATEEGSKRKKSKKNLVNDDPLKKKDDKIRNKEPLIDEYHVQNGQEALENRMEISNGDIENSMNNSLVVPKSKRKRKRCKKTKTIQEERCERKENTCNKQVNITNQETEAKANHIRFDESLNVQAEKMDEFRWENTLDKLNATEPRIIFATIVEPPVAVENIEEQDEQLLPVPTVNGDHKNLMNGEGKVHVEDITNNV